MTDQPDSTASNSPDETSTEANATPADSAGTATTAMPATPPGQVEGQELGNVRARQVTMHQSGAENIDAQSVSITNGGAKSINAKSVEMHNSGALTVGGETISMSQSSALIVNGGKVDIAQAGALAITASEVTIKGDTGTGLLFAGNVTSERDIRAVIGLVGQVNGGGSVRVALDARSALALGAGFAIVLRLLGRLFR